MKKILIGIFAAILAIVALAAAYIYWPQQPEDLSYLANSGDGYDAEILRDTFGVPHIYGTTDADAAYGLAYAHAEDDFLTIQQALLAARGDLATVYGQGAAPNDYMVQLLRVWETIDKGYESDISPEMRAMLEAYAAGLNHYAALHSEEALRGLFPVNGKDIVAGYVHKIPLFYGLDGVLGDLFADERKEDISPRLDNASFFFPNGAATYGSNAIGISPVRSANGQTFLAVNSHQPWTGLATWYEAHQHSEEGLDIVGGLFPGSPLVQLGHNRDLGWAFTVNEPDLVDVYVLEINPDNPDQYLYDGEWLDLEVADAPLEVNIAGRLNWTVKREILWSVYGPAVRQDHGTYAIRYSAIGELAFMDQFYRMSKATNFEEWQSAMAEGAIPMFNTVYADKEGNIFYVYNGLLPERSEFYDWELYLPGNTSETNWDSYVPFEELPQIYNPASGFVQSANNSPYTTTVGTENPIISDFSVTLGIENTMSNRSLRMLELFTADTAITEEEFYAYKYDMFYSNGSDTARFRERILAGFEPADEAEAAALETLRAWDLSVDPESNSAALGVMLLYFVNEAKRENPDVSINASELVGSTVPDGTLYEAFQQATAWLIEHYGQTDVEWQMVNRLRRGELDLGWGGGPDILHASYGQRSDDGIVESNNGDGYLILVTWEADGSVHARSIHQFGSATLVEDSPHYADQSPIFVERQTKPVWYEEADIRANLSRVYRPGEEVEP